MRPIDADAFMECVALAPDNTTDALMTKAFVMAALKSEIMAPTIQLAKDTKVPGKCRRQDFREGQYIIYQNGDTYEIGKVKRLTADGAFVWYSNGDTAAKTPYDCMHPIINEYTIGETGLGGAMT